MAVFSECLRTSGTPVVWVRPALATLSGLALDKFLYLFGLFGAILKLWWIFLLDVGHTVRYSDGTKLGTLKNFIRQLHDTLRYTFGMEHIGAWLGWVDSMEPGSVRKRHLLVIYERSSVILYFDFCVCLVYPSVAYESVFYFMYEKKQAYSVIRQGRFGMVRGKVLRNEYCLAIILRILKLICNPAMCTICTRVHIYSVHIFIYASF